MKKIFSKIFANKIFQFFFGALHEVSLLGLNYGNGGNFKESGELNVLKYLNRKFKHEESLIIFDVGSNVGKYAKALAAAFDGKTLIHSFEPSTKTYETLKENTKNIKNIILNNFGLSDVEETQLLYSDQAGSGLASVYQRNLDHFGIAMETSETISLSTIDDYCQANRIGRIHFLKLDIEGHELKALQGAKEMIDQNKIDVIQFEFGGCNIDSRTYFQDFYYFLKDKYKIFRILRNGLLELPEYKETYEIFITVNYLAVLKD